MTVSVCNPAAGTCHLEQRGLVQHATDRQPGHPLELSEGIAESSGGWSFGDLSFEIAILLQECLCLLAQLLVSALCRLSVQATPQQQ
jgi:hypothetical protein